LLALDAAILEEREEARLVLGGAGSMKVYTYPTARQRLAEGLEEASREGEVQIRRSPGPTRFLALERVEGDTLAESSLGPEPTAICGVI
jgi:hypothetical protein